MPRPVSLLLVLGTAAGLGAGAGFVARRLADRTLAPPPARRAAAVEALWRAHEGGDGAAFQATRARIDPAALTGGDRADVELLDALFAGDERALTDVARRHPGSSAAAYALWTLVERAPTPAVRAEREAAFRAAYPEGWRAASVTPGGP